MLFFNEYLSHGYTDTKRGILDSTVWDGRVYFQVGDLKMSNKGARFVGGSGGMLLQNILKSRGSEIAFSTFPMRYFFKKLNLDKV